MASAGRFERLRDTATAMLPRLLVPTTDRITLTLLDAPGAGEASDHEGPQQRAVGAYEGGVLAAEESACIAWLPNPALAIGSWLLLGDEVPGALGGAAEGFGHTHDLLGASLEEATALAALAGPDQLMLPFDVTGLVDLRDARFAVQSPDRGALVPWSCRLLRRRDEITVRDLVLDDAEACDAIIAGLPDWFGVERGVADCAEAVRSQPGLAAVGDGEVVGFVTWQRGDDTAEITWMAVRADRRRTGAGRALVDELLARLRTAGVRELVVKTLSSRHPDPGYAQTRAFYAAMGFVTVRELDIWGPDNPAVQLSRTV
jgi:ribosomal protein S18 acetylase RimI-like enzyme